MKNTFKAYFIQCITNMHVGSGDANYGVVDKQVQRDPVTNYPTIHASSLKGALREHYEKEWGSEDTKLNDIFGKEANGGNDTKTGSYKFLGADLVSLPVRCNFQQYVMGLNNKLIMDANRKSKMLVGKEIFNSLDQGNKFYYKNGQPVYELYAEDIAISAKEEHTNPLKVLSGLDAFTSKYASFSDDDFGTIAKNLAVIARNKLTNGKSDNLWYEEVIPHQSVFITFMSTTSDHFDEFNRALLAGPVQIGGNSSIGYGLCKFYEVKKTEAS